MGLRSKSKNRIGNAHSIGLRARMIPHITFFLKIKKREQHKNSIKRGSAAVAMNEYVDKMNRNKKRR